MKIYIKCLYLTILLNDKNIILDFWKSITSDKIKDISFYNMAKIFAEKYSE